MGENEKTGFTTARVEDLYDLHYEEMYLVARRYLNREEARDIVQDVFLKLLEKNDPENLSSARAYLYRTVINTCLNHLKHKKVEKEYALAFRIRLLEEEKKKMEGESEARVLEKELLMLIRTTVASFPEKNRRIFEMSRYEGYSHQKIADELGISVRTVEAQIYRALKVLQKNLKDFTGH